MSESYHYLLMSNHLLLQKMIFVRLKDTGLTIGQPKVLDYLKNHNGSAQKDIASGCHIEQASLTSILSGMEKKNLISRKISADDKRSFNVFMTEKGMEMQKLIEQEFNLLENQAFQNFSEQEYNNLIQSLEKIYNNLKGEN
ncbi:MAG: MarR family transcriptional regulator [Oscillospiraceae bacterium]|nr:MarR family transcriptional regulator [Oscillospiraceae bacterium]